MRGQRPLPPRYRNHLVQYFKDHDLPDDMLPDVIDVCTDIYNESREDVDRLQRDVDTLQEIVRKGAENIKSLM